MDSTLVGDGFSEGANAAVATTNETFVNIVSKRNGYRSKKFAYAFGTGEDALFNVELVLTDTLANQIARALAQNLVKGDLANTDTKGIVEEGVVLRTGSGTAANGTSRRFGGNSVAQIDARLTTLEDTVGGGGAYIDGEGGENGFSPLQPNVAYIMHRKTWGVIKSISRTSDNSLVSEGRTQLSSDIVRTLNGVPVVFDNNFDAPKGADNTFDQNAFIMAYGNFRYMLDRRIGIVRLHRDPYGVSGDNDQISVMEFAYGDNRAMGAIDSSSKCEAFAVYQANAA